MAVAVSRAGGLAFLGHEAEMKDIVVDPEEAFMLI